ncbi:hypothetical protein I302_108611 [Kwoniella bestiolae CBS 10118]|uniref:Uncharacterized protein n=1 Tax=Kwoniella bestiolae CBS 10118 TaxID=1296100 RepID=A0AAJ8MCN1_9TREE
MTSTNASTVPIFHKGKRLPSSSSSSSGRSSGDRYNPRTHSGIWQMMHDSLFSGNLDEKTRLRSELNYVMSSETPQGKEKDDTDRVKMMWSEITAPDASTGKSPTDKVMRGRWISKPRRMSCIRQMVPYPSSYNGTALDESLIQWDKVTPPPGYSYHPRTGRLTRTNSTERGDGQNGIRRTIGLVPECKAVQRKWEYIVSKTGTGQEPSEEEKRSRFESIDESFWERVKPSNIKVDQITPPPTSLNRQSKTAGTNGGRSTPRKGSGDLSLDQKRSIWSKQLTSFASQSNQTSPSSLAISTPASSIISAAA